MKATRKNKLLVTLSVICLSVILVLFAACGEAGGSESAAPGSDSSSDSKYDIVVTEDRLIVYDVKMNITVSDTTATLKQIKEDLREAGGYETSSSQNSNGYAVCVLRVPTVNLSDFLNKIEGKGTVNNCEIKSTDITEQYESVVAKKEVQLKYKEMLEEQLANATSVSDKQIIMKELSEVAAAIDRYDTELSSYKKQAEYSTVTVRIYGEKIYREPSYWDQLGEVFFGSTSSLGSVLGFILKIIAAILPYATLAVAVYALVVLVIFIVCKIRKKPFNFYKARKEKRELNRLEKQYKIQQQKKRIEELKKKVEKTDE